MREYGATINEKDEQGDTLIHLAILNDKIEVLKYLIHIKMDFRLKNNKSQTPLDLAISLDRKEFIECLENAAKNTKVENL